MAESVKDRKSREEREALAILQSGTSRPGQWVDVQVNPKRTYSVSRPSEIKVPDTVLRRLMDQGIEVRTVTYRTWGGKYGDDNHTTVVQARLRSGGPRWSDDVSIREDD